MHKSLQNHYLTYLSNKKGQRILIKKCIKNGTDDLRLKR